MAPKTYSELGQSGWLSLYITVFIFLNISPYDEVLDMMLLQERDVTVREAVLFCQAISAEVLLPRAE